MTQSELNSEMQYRRTERLGILIESDRQPTDLEVEIVNREESAFLQDLERQELLERVFTQSKINNRDYALKKRFSK